VFYWLYSPATLEEVPLPASSSWMDRAGGGADAE
jgi:hypothetical protein